RHVNRMVRLRADVGVAESGEGRAARTDAADGKTWPRLEAGRRTSRPARSIQEAIAAERTATKQPAVGKQAVRPQTPLVRSMSPFVSTVFSVTGLECSREIVHELLGIPYYWARGWWKS